MNPATVEALLEIWPRLAVRDRMAVITLAKALASPVRPSAPRVGPPVHPTIKVELPRTTDSARFDKVRSCPDCKGVIPPRVHKEHWSYCPDCGCPLPVWDWQ